MTVFSHLKGINILHQILRKIGEFYIRTLYEEIKKWLQFRAKNGPVGVTFSAGIDSGLVFLLTYHALRELGESPSRLKAFTLSVLTEVVLICSGKEISGNS